MLEERFSKGDSLIHKLDPRVRIVYCIIFSILVAVATKIEVAILALLISVTIVILAQLNLRDILARLLIVNTFIGLLWVIIPFSLRGHPIFTIGPLTASLEGISYTLLLTVKCNGIVLAGIGLISTSSIFELAHALKHMRVFDKFIYLFFLIYRYAHLVQSEYHRLRTALRVRGFRPQTSLLTYCTYGFVIGTLLVRSHDQAIQIHRAMLCRGFAGQYFLLDHFRIENRDIRVAAVMALSVVGLGILQWSRIVSL